MMNVERKVTRDGIKIHGSNDYNGMRMSCNLAAKTLDMISEHVYPGVTTDELDKICHDFIILNNATPATLGYRGYPKSSCISLNHVVCHGIPSNKKLKNGDMVYIGMTTYINKTIDNTVRRWEEKFKTEEDFKGDKWHKNNTGTIIKKLKLTLNVATSQFDHED